MFHETSSALIYVSKHYAPGVVVFNTIVIDLRVFWVIAIEQNYKNVSQQIAIYIHAVRFFYLKYKQRFISQVYTTNMF